MSYVNIYKFRNIKNEKFPSFLFIISFLSLVLDICILICDKKELNKKDREEKKTIFKKGSNVQKKRTL